VELNVALFVVVMAVVSALCISIFGRIGVGLAVLFWFVGLIGLAFSLAWVHRAVTEFQGSPFPGGSNSGARWDGALSRHKSEKHDSNMVRLVPMSEVEFRESFERTIVRRAADSVHRGVWSKEKATEAARSEMAVFIPQGRDSPGHRFVKVIDESNGKQVGEAWFSARDEGGKVRFWVDWLWTDPPQRRRGYATAVLQQLSREAAKLGADRMGLFVFADNPHAIALYTKLGFVSMVMGMSKPVQ